MLLGTIEHNKQTPLCDALVKFSFKIGVSSLWFPSGSGEGKCSVSPRDPDVDGGQCDCAGRRSGCPRGDQHSRQFIETGNVRLMLSLVACNGSVCYKCIIITGD